MDGTISTRTGEGQCTHGGLRAFLGSQGADAIAAASSTESAAAGLRPLPSAEEIREDSDAFLTAVFGEGWEGLLQPSRLEADPIDPRWVKRRIERLKPMSDGPMRLISQPIWELSTLLSQPDWFETWKPLALRCPADWLVKFCGVPLRLSPVARPPGKKSFNRGAEIQSLRSLDSRRVQSMLSLGVLIWQLAEYDPSDPRYPYVVRGLPYGAYQHLVAYWRDFADGAQWHVPGSTTLFGTHEAGGRWDRSECGYIESWCQAGIAKRYQPSGFEARPGMAGPWRERQRWAFVELRLAIATPGLAPLVEEPSARPWRKLPPPPATGELDAFTDEPSRSWYPDEVADNGEAAGGATQTAASGPTNSAAPTADEQTTALAWSATKSSAASRPLPASEWRALNALVDEIERDGYARAADSGGDADCCGLQEPASDATDSSPTRPPDSQTTTDDSKPKGPEVWRAGAPCEPQAVDEPASLEATEFAARETVKWLRARAKTDVVAACTLEPAGVQVAPSDKFTAALQAYEAEKARRAQARAEQSNKRKAPS